MPTVDQVDQQRQGFTRRLLPGGPLHDEIVDGPELDVGIAHASLPSAYRDGGPDPRLVENRKEGAGRIIPFAR